MMVRPFILTRWICKDVDKLLLIPDNSRVYVLDFRRLWSTERLRHYFQSEMVGFKFSASLRYAK